MKENKYIEGIGLYLINGSADYKKVYNALMRLGQKKDLKEIEQFEEFITFLKEKGHMPRPSTFLLKMTLSNFKVITERELDAAAAELRQRS